MSFEDYQLAVPDSDPAPEHVEGDWISAAEAYRQDVADRALYQLKMSDGVPTDDFCNQMEAFRRRTGTFPLPLEQLPCLDCPNRIHRGS